MKRLRAVLIFATALLLHAQDRVTPVEIKTEPAGARFLVDGREYRNSATFSWPIGSKHTLTFPQEFGETYQAGLDPGARYVFSGWADSTGQLQSSDLHVTVTANPAITSYTATATLSYAVRIEFSQLRTAEPLTSASCMWPGFPGNSSTVTGAVRVQGVCYWSDVTIWVNAGEVLDAQAFPYPGFTFSGWDTSNTVPGSVNPYLWRVPVTTPIWLRGRFITAKRVKFLTEPLGRDVTVDNQTVHTSPVFPCPPSLFIMPVGAPANLTPLCTGEFDFAPASKHVFSAPAAQRDPDGRNWVFRGWGTGSEKTINYTTGTVTNYPETFTASFVRGATASFVTVPSGMKLTIDGRDSSANPNFVWGVGEKHTVTAPAETTDSKGRKYTFAGWSNGGPATQDITITDENVDLGVRLVATYSLLNQAVLETNVPGLTIKVDGADCAAPCVVNGPVGKQIQVSVPAVVPVSDLTRYEFAGEATDWTMTLDRESQAVNVSYRRLNRLVADVDPGTGAELVADPASSDGFYPVNTQVALTASVKPGFKIRRWDGDIEWAENTGWVNMGSPRLVRLVLERVPYIAPDGVRNAAGVTPETGVAAGSVISIHGQSLVSAYHAGPTNPLAQTLGGVVVRVDDRFLPLLFVSPEQINALLPSDLPEGEHTLTVRTVGQPDVSAAFHVVRNAPGLFSTTFETQTFAHAMHQDGTPVTPASPAKRGEQVTLLGTGLGPYDRRPLDGFPLPAQPMITLVDTPEIVAGELRLPIVWAGGAAGMSGITAVRFRIPSELPSGAPELRVSVNGKLSNPVVLPVE